MAESPSPHRKSTAEKALAGTRRPVDLQSPLRYFPPKAAMRKVRVEASTPACSCPYRSAKSSDSRSMWTMMC